MQAGDDLFWVDHFKFGEFAKVLPIAVLLVSHNKGRPRILLHLLVVRKYQLVYHFPNVLERLVHDCGYPA
jgi:hypothetical protein